MRVEHLHVQNAVHTHLDVVARDADLLGDVDRDFLEAVPVGDLLDEGDENVKYGLQRAAVLAQILDHERTLLRHHRRGLCEHDDDDDGDRNGAVAQGNFQETLLLPTCHASACTTSVSPSTLWIRARAPAAMTDVPQLIAFHELPRYSMRHVSPGGSSAASVTTSPAGPLLMMGRVRRMRS